MRSLIVSASMVLLSASAFASEGKLMCGQSFEAQATVGVGTATVTVSGELKPNITIIQIHDDSQKNFEVFVDSNPALDARAYIVYQSQRLNLKNGSFYALERFDKKGQSSLRVTQGKIA